MNVFRQAPFARILPVFIFGIVFYQFAGNGFVVGLFSISLLLIFGITFNRTKFKWRFWNGIIFQIIFFSIGYLITWVYDDRNSEYYFQKIPGAELFLVKLEGKPIISRSGKRACVKVIAQKRGSTFIQSCGKLYVYLPEDSVSDNLKAGDCILFSKQPEEIKPPLNPGQFNFKQRAGLKHIYNLVRLQKGEWVYYGSQSKFLPVRFAENLRDQLLHTYKEAGISGSEYAVLSALVLGYDDEIDQATMASFSASGTLHILSVSGMHVGLVFMLLSFLFKKMEGKRYWWIVRLLSIVAILWFYALLTGLSPSVIRSAMMFSFILIGKSIRRDSNIYNTLTASVLTISICFDPLLIFDVGFQLSYLAVAGISFFYPYIFNWFYFTGRIVSAIWQLIAVSLAAQLATLPISIYYFHQFPNYFILANLLIIPVSTIGIFAGIILLPLKPFPWLLMKAGWLTSKIVWLQNSLALWIASLPLSVTTELYLPPVEVIIFYGLIAALSYYALSKSYFSLKVAMSVFSIFMISILIGKFQRQNEREIVVFSDSQHPAFQINWGERSFLFYDDSLSALKLSDQLLAERNLLKKNRRLMQLEAINETAEYKHPADSSIIFSNLWIEWQYGKEKKNYRIVIYPGDTLLTRRLMFSNKTAVRITDPYSLKNGAVVLKL